MKWPRTARRSDPAPASALFDETFQRRLETLALVSRRLASGRERGERRSANVGGGVEFADHRPYAPGDDFRFLDWKVFGRTDRVLLKQFEQEADLRVYVLLDVSASMAHAGGAKLRHGKRLAAALAYVALANLDRVSVQAFADALHERLAPMRGQSRVLRLLRFLEGLKTRGGTDFARCAKAFAARESQPGMALVLTDGYDFRNLRTGIDALRYARFEPVLLLITDPREAVPALRGELLLVDTETGEERQVTLTSGLLERYRAAREAHFAELTAYCHQKRVRVFELSIEQEFDQAILELLRRGGLIS